MTEQLLQSVLMRRALIELHHQIVLPNDTTFYRWEADLLTINKSGYVNEYECKVTKNDYNRDSKKRKFMTWPDGNPLYSRSEGPNYFWYVTLDFEIEPPEFAGWIIVRKNAIAYYDVLVMKPAPLLHKQKPQERLIKIASRLLSFKLMNFYHRLYIKSEAENVT